MHKISRFWNQTVATKSLPAPGSDIVVSAYIVRIYANDNGQNVQMLCTDDGTDADLSCKATNWESGIE